MNSDLQGELGPLDPGLDQLIGALTAQPASGELAGEQAVLAMFRENSRPSSGTLPVRGRPAAPAGRTARPPGGRAARISARWSLRLAGATALTLAGGLTAAAYANVLPAPVQHLAHVALSFADIPDTHPARHWHAPAHPSAGAGGPASSPAPRSAAPSAQAPSGQRPSATASRSPSPSAHRSPSPSTAAGKAQMSVSPVSSSIDAGLTVVIDGTLTKGGQALAGATVTLLERHSSHAAWHVAATATTDAQGSVAVNSPALITNTAFRLTGPHGARSAIVRVTVRPAISAVLKPGTGGRRDDLLVSTSYAHGGNIVVLQVESKTGAWVALRGRVLTTNGNARFAVNAVRLQNRVLRVVLRATARHAAAISSNITVPPPA
jgi:hypothetical protein